MIFFPSSPLKNERAEFNGFRFLLSVPQSVIRHAAFILFFFLVIFGFERYEKRAGDLNAPMRYLYRAHYSVPYGTGGFPIHLLSSAIFAIIGSLQCDVEV